MIHEGATFGDAIFNEGVAGRRAASIYAESELELLLLDRGPARRILKDYQAQRLKERADIIRGCKVFVDMDAASVMALAAIIAAR